MTAMLKVVLRRAIRILPLLGISVTLADGLTTDLLALEAVVVLLALVEVVALELMPPSTGEE